MKNDITSIDRLEAIRDDLTDGIVDMLFLRHFSGDDNPTAGDGIGIWWGLEESTYNTEFNASALDILSTDIVSGAEDVDWRLSTMIAGTLTEFLHVDADGGFFIKISPFVVQTDDATTEIRVHNFATDGDPYYSWALGTEAVPDIKFAMGVDDGDNDLLKIYSEDWQGTGYELLNVSAAATGLWKHLQGVEIEPTNAAGRTALLIDNNDTDQIALEFEAANIDADVIQITADAVTSAGVIDATVDSLTTGFGIRLTSSSSALANGELLTINHTSSAITAAKTGDGIDIDFNRTLAAGGVIDNYNALSFTRTSQTSAAVTITAQGTVLTLENADIAGGAGTVTDSVDVLSIIQDILSTGQSIQVDHNGAAGAVTIVSGSDAATSTLGITNEAGGYGINVSRNLAAVDTDSPLVYINDDGASDQAALHIHTDAVSDASARALLIDADLITTQQAFELTADALTGGIGVNLTSASTNLTTNGRILKVDATGDFDDAGGQVVEIASIHTTGTGLQLTMDAVTDGYGQFITADALTSGIAFKSESSSTGLTGAGRLLLVEMTADFNDATGFVAEIKSAHATGTGLLVTTDSATDGYGMQLTADALSSGIGMELTSTSTALTTSGRVFEVNHSADFDDTGGYIANFAGAFTTGRLVNIINNAVIDGFLLHINSASTVLDATGRMLMLDHTGNATALGILAELQTTAADETILLQLTADSLTSGSVLAGTFDALTTGIAVNLTSTSDVLAAGEILAINHAATAITVAKTGDGIDVDFNRTLAAGAVTDNYNAMSLTRTSQTNAAVIITAQGSVMRLENADTAGGGGTVTDSVDVLQIIQDALSTGNSLDIDHNANSIAILLVGEQTTADVIDISATVLTEGTVIDISDLDAITIGKALHIDATGITQTTGILAHLDSGSTALTGVGRILLVDHTAATTNTGTISEFQTIANDDTILTQFTADSLTSGQVISLTADALSSGIGVNLTSTSTALTTNGRLLRVIHSADFDHADGYIAEISGAFTTGRGLNVVNDVITDGFLVHINSSSTVLDATGRMLMVDHTGASTAGVGAIAEIASAATDDTTIVKITGSGALAAGIGLDISLAAMTTGTAIDISNLDTISSGKALHIDATGVTHDTGILIHIDSASTAITGVGRLLLIDHTGNATVTGIIAELQTVANDETILLQLTADALTTGSVLASTFDALTTGTGFGLTSTSNTLAAGEMLTINHTATGVTVAKTGDGIDIDFNRTLAAGAVTDNYNAMSLTRESATSAAVVITAQGSVLRLENADTAGGAGTVTDSVDVLQLIQDALSTGNSLDIDHNANSIAINLVGSQTTADVIDISVTGLTDGTVIDISDLDAITIGKGIHIDATGVTQTTGILAHIDSASTALTGVGRILLVDHTGNATNAGTIVEFQTIATDDTVLLQMTADALTSGTVLNATGDALSTGRGFLFDSTSVGLTSGELLTIGRTASGTLAAKSGNFTSISDTTTHTADTDITLNYDALEILRSHTRDTGGVDTHATTGQGTVLRLENAVLATTGTITDTVDILNITQDADSVGQSLEIDHNPTGSVAVSILASNTTANIVDISATGLTSGTAIDLSDLDALIDGKGIHLDAGNATQTTGILLHVDSAGTAITGAGRLLLVDHTGTETITGTIAELQTIADDETILLQLTADSLTSGTVLAGTFDALTTGTAVNLTSSSNVLAAGEMLAINHTATGITVGKTGEGIDIDFDRTLAAGGPITDNYTAFALTRTSATSAAVAITAQGAIALIENVNTAGGGGTVTDSVDVLQLIQDANSTGNSIDIDHNAESVAISLVGSQTTADVIDLSLAGLLSGTAIDISNLDAITTGKAIHIDATGNTQTDGILVHIDSASTLLTATGRLLLVDHTGNATAVQGAIAEIASAATDDTTIAKITASGLLAAGRALEVSVASMTTGAALAIVDGDALTTGTLASLISNSADVSARYLVGIKNDNVLAVGAVPLLLENDASSHDFEMINSDPGTEGIVINLHHNSANPAVDDVIASFEYNGEDSASNETEYAVKEVIIADETSGSEEGRVIHYTAQLAGTKTETFREEIGDLRPVRLNSQSYEWIEDFDDEASGVQFEAGLVADFWTTAGTNYAAGNVTYTEDAGGTLQALTAGANLDSVTAVGLLNFRINADPILEARFKVLDIANVYIAVGFVLAAYVAKAAPDTDIAVVGIDSDNDDHICFWTNDNNAGAVENDSGLSITANTFITIRIDLTDTENPRCWINAAGGLITAANEVDPSLITGTVQAGISIAPYFMVESLSGAADTFTIDYIKTWQSR